MIVMATMEQSCSNTIFVCIVWLMKCNYLSLCGIVVTSVTIATMHILLHVNMSHDGIQLGYCLCEDL